MTTDTNEVSDTPRTDAAYKDHDWDIMDHVPLEFAKQLERELETCKNAQAEINNLHTENVCLQELIQEFYEWSRRDYPTEQEVREIMNRYHDLLNK